MSQAITFEELFDPDFLNSLNHLSIKARRIAGGGRYGEKLSKDKGSGIEFRDFRPYSPGDDLRSIDWNIYRRLGRVFIRLFEEQQDMPLYLMPDLSQSMFLDEPPKARAAFQTALAFASISMNHHDSAGLFPFGDQLEVVLKNKSGKANVMNFAKHLSQLRPQDQTDLEAAVKRMVSMRLRPGLLVIISDFFLPNGLESFRDALRSVRHKILLIQVTRQSDSDPQLNGQFRLQDCETGQSEDVSITPALLKSYRAAWADFNEQLTDIAKNFRAGLLQLDSDADAVQQLSSLFESGNLQI